MDDLNFHAYDQENIDQFLASSGWIDMRINLMDIHNLGYIFVNKRRNLSAMSD